MLNTEMDDFDMESVGPCPVVRSCTPSGKSDAWEFDFFTKSHSLIELRGLFEDLQDRIRRLESESARLQNQLKRSNQHHHSHCTRLADVCVDLENYLMRDSDVLMTSLEAENSDIEPLNLPPDPVKELLLNFREEIERQGQRTELRLSQMEETLNELKQSIAQHRPRSLSNSRTSVEENALKIQRRFSIEKTNLEGFLQSQPLIDSTAIPEREITNSLNRAQSPSKEYIDLPIPNFHPNFVQSAALKATPSANVESLQHCVQGLETSMRETVEKWNHQHMQLSKNAYNVQSHIQQQQDELQFVKEALREHREQITELQGITPLDGVFQEIKDWLIDLEKRAVNHGEMQKQMKRVEAELVELRKGLNLVNMKTGNGE
ncbi:unnamed protein product [Phytomonas sp. Hart1]|nr:unnamed protein product [Phytomonas sp. Hart1]|eukprot:CCW69923.1 unnamed protein product [Phytomonas sp. isolate Hart1]